MLNSNYKRVAGAKGDESASIAILKHLNWRWKSQVSTQVKLFIKKIVDFVQPYQSREIFNESVTK